MNCIKCGMEIPDGARFCNFCGVKQELTCASCGAVLPNGARFCHMCGSPVQSETSPEPPSDPFGSDPNADPDPYDDLIDVWSDDDDEVDEVDEALAEEQGPVYPNEQNFRELFLIDGRFSRAYNRRGDEWALKLQHNDIHCDPDPDHHCYGSISIIDRESGQVIPGLDCLMAYTLSERGMYYADRAGEICFLRSDGHKEVLGRQENVIHLFYALGTLTVTYVKDRRQTVHNGHAAACYGLPESWYDIYELDVGKRYIQHPDDSHQAFLDKIEP